jgi:uncharacterized DUF497 family protein
MASLALQVGLHLALELFAGLAQALEALASEDICPYTLTMRIDWDPIKAAANLREHKVSFAEAATVLSDEFALTREDPDSVGEQRFVSLGMCATGLLLVVVYTHREPDIYRIISAWKAIKPQRNQYEKARR